MQLHYYTRHISYVSLKKIKQLAHMSIEITFLRFCLTVGKKNGEDDRRNPQNITLFPGAAWTDFQLYSCLYYRTPPYVPRKPLLFFKWNFSLLSPKLFFTLNILLYTVKFFYLHT